MSSLIDTVICRWQTATLTDYAHVVLGIVVIAWFASRNQK